MASGSGTQGCYYVVNVAGSTNLDGITDWQIGDWAVFNGTIWEKIDNTDIIQTVANVGAGSQIFKNIIANTINLRSLLPDSLGSITLTQNTDDIRINLNSVLKYGEWQSIAGASVKVANMTRLLVETTTSDGGIMISRDSTGGNNSANLYFGDRILGIEEFGISYKNDTKLHLERFSGGNQVYRFVSSTGQARFEGDNIYFDNQVYLPALTVGSNADFLTIDGSGRIQKQTISAGNNIYTTDDTLTGDRTVNMSNNFLLFVNNPQFRIDPTPASPNRFIITRDNASTASVNFRRSSDGVLTRFIQQETTEDMTFNSDTVSDIMSITSSKVRIPSATTSTDTEYLTVDGTGIVSKRTAPVVSVFGRTGAVVAVANDYDISEIQNSSVLADDSNVNIAGATSGQVLSYDGAQWVNSSLTAKSYGHAYITSNVNDTSIGTSGTYYLINMSGITTTFSSGDLLFGTNSFQYTGVPTKKLRITITMSVRSPNSDNTAIGMRMANNLTVSPADPNTTKQNFIRDKDWSEPITLEHVYNMASGDTVSIFATTLNKTTDVRVEHYSITVVEL